MITFHFEEVDSILLDESKISDWIKNCCFQENYILSELSIICCSDEYLLDINRNYLNHDYYTDIITFDLSDGKDIEGELYISLDRVVENAKELDIPFLQELHRVIIHGVLHLIGYSDKTEDDQKLMRSKEDAYLSLLL